MPETKRARPAVAATPPKALRWPPRSAPRLRSCASWASKPSAPTSLGRGEQCKESYYICLYMLYMLYISICMSICYIYTCLYIYMLYLHMSIEVHLFLSLSYVFISLICDIKSIRVSFALRTSLWLRTTEEVLTRQLAAASEPQQLGHARALHGMRSDERDVKGIKELNK